MMKLQLLVINCLFLCAMASISSTSKDHAVVGNKNTQNNEVLLDLNQNQSQYEQGYQDQQEVFKKVQNRISKFKGVCWDKDQKKWRSQLAYNKQKYNGGLFDNQEDAAMKVNLLCDKCGTERKNPTIDIKLNAIQQKHKISKFIGVSWNSTRKEWKAELVHNNKHYHGGLFDNEEHAAMKVNLLCDDKKIKHKNPSINIIPNAIQQKLKNKTSIYAGVYWNNEKKKWQVRLSHNKKRYHGGNFDNEECAAMNVNVLCDKVGMGRKNPTIDITPNTIQQVQNRISKYNGVYWKKDYKKWKAELGHKKKKYYGGVFDNEEHAAMKVNLICDKLEIERRNPTVDIKPNAIQQKNQTSNFTGVSWNNDSKKWQTHLMCNKKNYHGGIFDNEEHAAMKVNLLCDMNGIERKNPTININLNEIQEKTKPMMHQSKSKNVVNENIKVEDENKFKNECENRFMKSNEDALPQSHANEKRKRKQNSIVNDDIMEEKVEITTPNHNESKLLQKMQKY